MKQKKSEESTTKSGAFPLFHRGKFTNLHGKSGAISYTAISPHWVSGTSVHTKERVIVGMYVEFGGLGSPESDTEDFHFEVVVTNARNSEIRILNSTL